MADRSTSQSQGDPTQRELSASEDGAPDHRPTFGELLRRYRREAGLTQEALAERARLSARAIAALERGVNRAPRRDTLQLLAEALDLTGPARAAFEAAARWSGAAQARAAPGTGMVAPPGALSTEPLASRATLPTNLPLALTGFVGREQELAAVRRLLGETRLLTLTGAGGCGKTRLALEVARALAGDSSTAAYADGIWLVEFGALGERALVPRAVARAIGMHEKHGHALMDSLSAFLRPRHMLLLLDNCEHLLPACAHVAEALLCVCPHLSILATSREALRIGGEHTWRVPSLRLPEPRGLLSDEQVLACEAVQLFVQCARAVRPEFAPVGRQVGLMAHVCQRLDGIPLAIELAAARLAALSLDQVAARLDDRFRLLTNGSRTAVPRQQTLRATLDWSYDLLGERERLLLRRLAVFAGGWTLEAAEAVCAGDGIAREDVLNLLAGLVAKSLAVLEEGGAAPRYRLLEMVRQYAGEKLLATGDAAPVQDRHLDWSVSLAEQAARRIGGAEREWWLDQLDAEVANLRTALAWSRAREGQPESGLRLATALEDFWYMRGYVGEGRRWMHDLLEHAGTTAQGRARGLDVVALLTFYQGDHAQAMALFEAAYALHTSAGHVHRATWSLTHQAMAAISLGTYQQATTLLERVLPAHQAQGDRHGVAWVRNYQGRIQHLQGNYAGAATLYEQSLAVFHELGDKFGVCNELDRLANVARDLGQYGQAQRLYRESLQLRRSLRDKPGIADCLEGLAVVVAVAGQPVRAARLLGAAHGLREVIGTPVDVEVLNRPAYDRTVAEVRAALGEADFAAAWEAGQALELEEAITLALEGGSSPS